MNIDFNAAFDAGLTKEQIMEMMQDSLHRAIDEREKAEQERKAAEEKKIQENESKARKEDLKREGRAYLINALIAYSDAFDLLDEGETWGEEEIAKAEDAIKRIEEMIPLYVKLAKLQGEMDKRFGIEGFGLGGLL